MIAVTAPSSPAPWTFSPPVGRAQSFFPLVASSAKSSPPPVATITVPAMIGRASIACANVHFAPPAERLPDQLGRAPRHRHHDVGAGGRVRVRELLLDEGHRIAAVVDPVRGEKADRRRSAAPRQRREEDEREDAATGVDRAAPSADAPSGAPHGATPLVASTPWSIACFTRADHARRPPLLHVAQELVPLGRPELAHPSNQLDLLIVVDLGRRPEEDLVEPPGHDVERKLPQLPRELVALGRDAELTNRRGGLSHAMVERDEQIAHGVLRFQRAEPGRRQSADRGVPVRERAPERSYCRGALGSGERFHGRLANRGVPVHRVPGERLRRRLDLHVAERVDRRQRERARQPAVEQIRDRSRGGLRPLARRPDVVERRLDRRFVP